MKKRKKKERLLQVAVLEATEQRYGFNNGPTKDRKGLQLQKRTEKNFRPPKRTVICYFYVIKTFVLELMILS